MIVLTGWRHYKVFANWSEAIKPGSVLGTPVTEFKLDTAKRMLKTEKGNLQSDDCGCRQRDVLRVPSFYVAQFTLNEETLLGEERVLALNMGDCGFKGVAFLNGFPLGRYWPVMGPQVTLYIPQQTVSFGRQPLAINTLVLFELERDARPCLSVYITDKHIINGTTPGNYRLHKEEQDQLKEETKHPKTKSPGWPDGYDHWK